MASPNDVMWMTEETPVTNPEPASNSTRTSLASAKNGAEPGVIVDPRIRSATEPELTVTIGVAVLVATMLILSSSEIVSNVAPSLILRVVKPSVNAARNSVSGPTV